MCKDRNETEIVAENEGVVGLRLRRLLRREEAEEEEVSPDAWYRQWTTPSDKDAP